MAANPSGTSPRLIVGLGNPGSQYAATRHNAGFMTIDAYAATVRHSFWFPKANASVCTVKEAEGKLVLAKPQTFMNRSGSAVKRLAAHYGFDLEDVLVIHDDLDLPAGTLRVKVGGGHGGHNGLRDIVAIWGADFARLRVGIGRPPGQMPADRHVLQPLRNEILDDFMASIDEAAEILAYILSDGVQAAQNRYNVK